MTAKYIKQAFFTILLLAGFCVGGGYAQCGVERTAVKSLSDPLASQIDFSKAEPATIAELTTLPEMKGDAPRRKCESRIVAVHAIIYSYGVESDGDYHLCIKDAQGHKMIAEIPNPKCPDASHSGHAKEYADARNLIDQTLGKASKKFKKCNRNMIITGTPFFDTKIHGQTGHADDDLEIHPVTKIEFL